MTGETGETVERGQGTCLWPGRKARAAASWPRFTAYLGRGGGVIALLTLSAASDVVNDVIMTHNNNNNNGKTGS